MSQQFDNRNRGSIWRNERKQKDTDPDFTGSGNLDGVEVWINAWRRKEGASPKAPALTFSFKQKEAQRADTPQRNRVAGSSNADLDDQIPF